MTDYQWTGAVSQAASTAGNWIPSGPPGASDKAIFDAAATQNCNWDIASVNEIEIKSTYAQTLTLTTDISLNGLIISAAGKIVAGSAKGLTFTGTPPYKSGKCYVENGTASSPFNAVSSRNNTTYTMSPSSGDLYFDTGIYPNVKLGGAGNKTPQYIAPTVANSTDVNFLTLRISAGAFAPASATPTDNDKLKNFIIDASSSQLTIDPSGITSFDGGYATWTFQGKSSGFLIPTSNLADYQGCDFTFRRMSIVATTDGAGAWAKLNANSRLYLTDLTIGVGASLKGAGACAIHLINRPIIKGTWGFFSIADGIYHPKEGEVLGVANGGTGLSNIAQYQIPFGTDGNALTTSTRLTFNNTTNVFAIDGKLDVSGLIDPTGLELTPVASNPGGVAANTLWLNSGDSNKLYHGSSEIAGGGGGGGTVDVVSNVATNTILGRNDGGSGDSEELTPAEVRIMLNVEDGADATDATNVAAAGAVMSVAPITLDTGNNRVGINEASPDYDLHVHGGGNYTVKFEHGEGQTLFNKYGHIQIFNDNASPFDGATLDDPVWQIGQRDGGQLDIALGNISTQLVPASKQMLQLKRVGNTESGAAQIGFLGATAVSQQTVALVNSISRNGNPADPEANADAINAIIAALQAFGLFA